MIGPRERTSDDVVRAMCDALNRPNVNLDDKFSCALLMHAHSFNAREVGHYLVAAVTIARIKRTRPREFIAG